MCGWWPVKKKKNETPLERAWRKLKKAEKRYLEEIKKEEEKKGKKE